MWKREVSLGFFGSGVMSVSDNGKWLLLHGWTILVMDAESGETMFEFSTTEEPQVKMERLSSVLPEIAYERDIGNLGGVDFEDDYLLFYRRHGNINECNVVSGDEYDPVARYECIRNLKKNGHYSTFFDVFDMNNIKQESSPVLRTEYERELRKV